jgi:P27 family predicted phage terminase small subunit
MGEAYCVSYGHWREAEEALVGAPLLVSGAKGRTISNPLIAAAAAARKDVKIFAAEFGPSPVTRPRVSVASVSPNSKFGDLIS